MRWTGIEKQQLNMCLNLSGKQQMGEIFKTEVTLWNTQYPWKEKQRWFVLCCSFHKFCPSVPTWTIILSSAAAAPPKVLFTRLSPSPSLSVCLCLSLIEHLTRGTWMRLNIKLNFITEICTKLSSWIEEVNLQHLTNCDSPHKQNGECKNAPSKMRCCLSPHTHRGKVKTQFNI